MASTAKKLLGIYFLLVLVKLAFVFFISSPTVFSDEYVYAKTAWSIFHGEGISVHGIPTVSYPPMYSLVLSITYLAHDMGLVYALMKLLNVLLGSLLIFPAYLLLKDMVDKKKALYGALLVGFIPLSFAVSPYLMSENLFHPLFLFSFYAIFQLATTKKSISYGLFTGLLIGLTLLTRTIGLVLLPLLLFALIYQFKKKEIHHVKLLGLAFVIALAVRGLWFLREVLIKADYLQFTVERNFIPHTETSIFFMGLMFFLWLCMYATYIILSTGVLPLFYLKVRRLTNEKTKLFVSLALALFVFTIIAFAAREAASAPKETTLIPDMIGRLIGRYADMAIIPLFLAGFVCMSSFADARFLKRRALLLASLVLLGSQILYFPLIPFNNVSLALLGGAKMALAYFSTGVLDPAHLPFVIFVFVMALLLGGIFLLGTLLARKKISLKIIYLGLLSFFLLTNAASLAITTSNAVTWSENEQFQLGKALDKLTPSNAQIVIDSAYCAEIITPNDSYLCRTNKGMTYVGFWINNAIAIESLNTTKPGDYIITRADLDEPLIMKTDSGILVYQKA